MCAYFSKKKNHMELDIGWLFKCFGFGNHFTIGGALDAVVAYTKIPLG